MGRCGRCVSRKTHYAVKLEASLQRQVHGWGSSGVTTETEVRHHPPRAVTTIMVRLVVTLGSLSSNSDLHEIVELPARKRKFGQPWNFEDRRWVISCIGQVTLGKLTIARSLRELLLGVPCLLSLYQASTSLNERRSFKLLKFCVHWNERWELVFVMTVENANTLFQWLVK